MTVPVERWTAGGTRYLVVDASDHVRDRLAFAAAHCQAGEGPDAGDATGDVRDPADCGNGDGEEGCATDGGHDPVDCGNDDRTPAGVLFLASDPDPVPPRVVTTLVGPSGRRVVRPEAARVAAAWAARRTGAEAVMVDAPRGTLRADVADAEAGRSVTVPDPRTGANASGVVVRADDGAVPRVPPRQVE